MCSRLLVSFEFSRNLKLKASFKPSKRNFTAIHAKKNCVAMKNLKTFSRKKLKTPSMLNVFKLSTTEQKSGPETLIIKIRPIFTDTTILIKFFCFSASVLICNAVSLKK